MLVNRGTAEPCTAASFLTRRRMTLPSSYWWVCARLFGRSDSEFGLMRRHLPLTKVGQAVTATPAANGWLRATLESGHEGTAEWDGP
jgi:hypothetical protein